MQRHESLVPLSKDHYEGLLLALQIKTKDRIMLVGWPKEAAAQGKFIARFYQERLVRHFEAEEKALFPLIVEHIPSGKKQVEDLLNDHRSIEKFIGDFEKPGAPSSSQLHEFSDLLERHIRKEERELFPLFEKEASPDILQRAKELLSRD